MAAFTIQEISRLLRETQEPQYMMDASTYSRALDEAVAALAIHDASPSSPLALLCALLQGDRRLRCALAERCQFAGEV